MWAAVIYVYLLQNTQWCTTKESLIAAQTELAAYFFV